MNAGLFSHSSPSAHAQQLAWRSSQQLGPSQRAFDGGGASCGGQSTASTAGPAPAHCVR